MTIKRIDQSESDLVTELFNEYRMFYGQSPDLSLAEKFINTRLENNESVIFVALEQHGQEIKPVGFTQLYPVYSSVRACKNWILNDLFVKKEYRGKGARYQLIKNAMDFAQTNGATYMQLETATDNYNAQKLYESIGFQKKPADNSFFVYTISLSEQAVTAK
ncbi:GNAT family N-acetyltransferase [Danxiaibacter flavus]|uniref:GNAT family N-acetyltransferase n=1 Tax=Danxiaibacter flavus TaxID=3049108 RepID=A0ABV3ZC51_9BACT|nr:GNAT family N-acetyltransferase [Chitinophagaceae bacterium DXS]